MLEGEPPITSKQKYDLITISDESKFMVEPHEYILGTTKEFIAIPDGYIGVLKGKSSLGRLGIQVFYSGGYIDPKFKGSLVLEIFNANKVPVALHPGMAIAKLAILPISKPHIGESKVAEQIFGHKEIEDLAKWLVEKASKD